MVAPPRPVAPAGLGAVGTPRNGRGVGTMETMMTKKIGQPKQPGNARAAKAKTAAHRGRQRPQTKKQIGIALLEQYPGFEQSREQLAVQEFVSEPAVEALRIRVLPWTARFDEQRARSSARQPPPERDGDQPENPL